MASVDGARASDKPTDAYYKFKCDPCEFSGLAKEASMYCKQCEEYMCIRCASAHMGSKLTRNHTMVSGSYLASTGQSVAASRITRPESTVQSVAASRSTRPESAGQSVVASLSTRPESTGQSVAAHVSTGQSEEASRSTHPVSTGQSVAASLSTRPESTGQSVAAHVSTGQSEEASRSTHPVSTGQSVAASRSTRPESTGPSGVSQPVATSSSACPDYSCKSWLDVEVVSSNAINVSSNDVTCSAVMPDGRVILADWQNKQIILLDKDFTVHSTLALPAKPYDVAVYRDNTAVVTMPEMNQLQYIHVDMTLRASHTIQTKLRCRGVAVHGGEMYVGVSGGQYGRHVQVMDTRGNVTRRIGADVRGRDRWYIEDFITVTVGTGGAVYISDGFNDHITCFTSAGDVVYDVEHEGMSHPRGILLDKGDNLLVCCAGSDTIHVLGKDGAHRRVILSSADGVVRPRSVSYRRSDQMLIVTMYNTTPSVRAYKLN